MRFYLSEIISVYKPCRQDSTIPRLMSSNILSRKNNRREGDALQSARYRLPLISEKTPEKAPRSRCLPPRFSPPATPKYITLALHGPEMAGGLPLPPSAGIAPSNGKRPTQGPQRPTRRYRQKQPRANHRSMIGMVYFFMPSPLYSFFRSAMRALNRSSSSKEQ